MSWLDRLAGILPHLPPSLPQLVGLGAVALVALAFTGLGGAIGGRERLPEADGFVGWGVVVAAFTAIGTLGAVPFTWIVALLLIASIVGYAVRARPGHTDPLFPPSAGAALALAVPLLLVTLSMRASQWDEFTQWLHSARYLYQYDVFPGPGRPISEAIYPAYPYALPLVGYLASRIASAFVEGALAQFNLLMLLGVGLLFARLIRIGLGSRGSPVGSGRSMAGQTVEWSRVALGLLLATGLSPSFVPRLVLSAYAETGTAATVAVAGVLGWAALEQAAGGDRAAAVRLAARMGLVLAVLVALKEATLALFLLVLGAVALAGLRRTGVGWRALGAIVLVGALPGAVVHLAWRLYVAGALPGQEFGLLPWSQWHWSMAPVILGAMANVALAKAGHFGLMLVLAGCALRALVRPRGQGRGGFESLAIIAGAVMVGYNLFLFVTYVGVFAPSDAEHVASFWRYNTHVGLIGMAAASLGGATLWRRSVQRRLAGGARRALGGLTVGLAVLGPLALLSHLRFDVEPGKLFARQLGETLGRTLPSDARLLVVDLQEAGFYPLLVNYMLDGRGHVVGAVSALTPDQPATLRRLIRDDRPTHLLAFPPDRLVEAVTETALPRDTATLLTREPDGAWRIAKTWPMPRAALLASGK